MANGFIEIVKCDGKIYIDIKDYVKVWELFGELLCEVQCIKLQGDYEVGKNLIEIYGVQVDVELYVEVLCWLEKFNILFYGGFINFCFVLVISEDGVIIDIKIEYLVDFME